MLLRDGSLRDQIISEIRRIATDLDGKPPGKRQFTNITGITEGKWSGVYWARWSEALAEAGFTPNVLHQRLPSVGILESIAAFCRELGRLPTASEMRLRRRHDIDFPVHSTIENHFGSKAGLAAALRSHAAQISDTRLLGMLPREILAAEPVMKAAQDGSVYLMKSGAHYKIGRSDDVERRVREIGVRQPEPLTIIHTIRTDDPSGIESYWHRRFADRRANGEWFRLTISDVKVFRRRNFQ